MFEASQANAGIVNCMRAKRMKYCNAIAFVEISSCVTVALVVVHVDDVLLELKWLLVDVNSRCC